MGRRLDICPYKADRVLHARPARRGTRFHVRRGLTRVRLTQTDIALIPKPWCYSTPARACFSPTMSAPRSLPSVAIPL
jgi:hypothetical protein